jgi:hypothetical protein
MLHERIEKLIELREKVQPLFAEAQEKMLKEKAVLETVEQIAKERKIAALGNAKGANADIREAIALADEDVQNAYYTVNVARASFNAAYVEYKTQEATIAYIRDVTALLGLPQ